MKTPLMSLEDQVKEAIRAIKDLFDGVKEPIKNPTPPEGATLEGLWAIIIAQQDELATLKTKKRNGHPKVEDAVKRLVTDPKLAQIPIPMVANIIRDVFNLYNVKSACSEGSVRWYISQKSLVWDVVSRQLPTIHVIVRETDEPSNDSD